MHINKENIGLLDELFGSNIYYLLLEEEKFNLTNFCRINFAEKPKINSINVDRIKDALLIFYHPETNKDIKKIRNSLVSKGLNIPYGDMSSVMRFNLSKSTLSIDLKKATHDFIIKYRLHEDWDIPIKCWILLEELPIPLSGKDENLELYNPSQYNLEMKGAMKELLGGMTEANAVESLVTRSNYEDFAGMYLMENKEYPMIIIRGPISENELSTWFKTNKEIISKATHTLAFKRLTQTNMTDFILGLFIWKKNYMGSSKIEKILNDFEKRHPDLYDLIPDVAGYPKHRERAIEKLQSFYPF